MRADVLPWDGVSPPWKAVRAVVTALVAWGGRQVQSRIHVSPVSEQWLREAEARAARQGEP